MSDPADRPFDPGLQPERTALAWRRTALSIGVGALVAGRILPAVFGVWTVVPAVCGLVSAIVVFLLSERRYRRAHRHLTSDSGTRAVLPDGTLPALVTGIALLAGLTGAACIFSA